MHREFAELSLWSDGSSSTSSASSATTVHQAKL